MDVSVTPRLAGEAMPELLHYNAVARWDGAYPQTLVGADSAGLLLQMPEPSR